MLYKFDSLSRNFVNTSEAYSKYFVIGHRNIIIPYVNITLMPRNPISGTQSCVDFSYYILNSVHQYNIPELGTRNVGADENALSLLEEYVSIFNFNDPGYEMCVFCEYLSFFLPGSSKVNKDSQSFIPIETPNYAQNLKQKDIASFFKISSLPENLKLLVGSSAKLITLDKF